ncbi:MAG TPA: poly-beta-1,6-N-acetyl-D-glucosamine N-deacetylase PgaB [Candidatus Polarisedimenticolaceae bacterium]|nr:poly-beta-1,6-N-acetyl-D-glucosamine N-deacetylase PgaB [Candidatus Polarisedimenticolaceae bacterium]
MTRAAIAFLALSITAAGAADVELVTLTYHDVRSHLVGNHDPDRYAVSSANLAAHFRWLASQGYHVVSVERIAAALAGGEPLPPRAVLLTFDDGFRSAYTHVFPLLETFGYPAVLSLVTSWIEAEGAIDYDGVALGPEDFLSWAQIREMQASGLVEIASHSHDLHRGIRANPQGNLEPAAVALAWDDEGYESEANYRERVAADLSTSARAIEDHTGRRPRVIAWPFGAWNRPIREIAAGLGMELSLTLQEVEFASRDGVFGREMLVSNPGIPRFSAMFAPRQARPLRAAQVDLDYVYDADPERQEINLGLLLDRIEQLEISHVFLQAFADPDGDGAADALYFPNRRLPVRADLFNRAAWQLRTRAHVRVFAWLPLLAYRGEAVDPDWRVLQQAGDTRQPDPAGETRLSPFHPDARRFIADIYRDLALHAQLDGIHFHDDGRLNEFEDVSPAALGAYERETGEPFSFDGVDRDADRTRRWAAIKSAALIEFSRELVEIVRVWHPGSLTSRNLFAPAVVDPEAEIYLAQDYADYLANYDYTTLMAMPRLEDTERERRFYRRLIQAVGGVAAGLDKTVFQLQTVDWRSGRPIPSDELRDTLRFLQSYGVRHLAYYPDDLVAGHPRVDLLRQGLSLADMPRSGDR